MINKWINSYPGLTKYKKNNLYCITGPFLLGLELIKLPRVKEYRPHFTLHSLYGLPDGYSIEECLRYPVLLFQFYNSKNLQYSLKYDDEIEDAMKSIDKFLTFGLGSDISYNSFEDWLGQVVINPKYSFLIKLPEIFAIRYNLALYFSSERAEFVLNTINSKTWDDKHFKRYGGRDKWYDYLTRKSREEQNSIIDENINSKELRSLKRYDIIV